MRAAEKVASTVFNDFEAYVYKLGKELSAQNTAVNALAVGVNEEYLLSRFPKTMTIQKANQELIKTLPQSRIVDYNEISNFTAFMASPYSSGLSGQMVHLNHAL
jgi:enoyl-[acyl-carrier-protein] reductase (NADH)